jgi:hypothetical protein
VDTTVSVAAEDGAGVVVAGVEPTTGSLLGLLVDDPELLDEPLVVGAGVVEDDSDGDVVVVVGVAVVELGVEELEHTRDWPLQV